MISVKLYEKIYNGLKQRIESGEFSGGKLLPTEKSLQEEFGVSRITVKQAYAKLSEEGLITRVAGKGTTLAVKSEARKSKLIGVVMCDFDSTFGERLIKSIEKNAEKHGYSIIIKRSFDNHKKEIYVLNELTALGVDGIIIQNCHGAFTKNLIELFLKDFPLISVDRYAKGLLIPSVTSDNFSASISATEYLINKGHEKILFASVPTQSTSTLTERLDGFKQAHINSEISLSTENFVVNLKSPVTKNENDIKADIALLKSHIMKNKITAIVAAERFAAGLCAKAAAELGLSFPENIEMICFDYEDTFLSQSKYTHILQNEEEMGAVCVDMLIKRINNENITLRSTVKSKLIIGNSTFDGEQSQ